jgi:sugar/nucleoside kinase (ribokinase family)
MNEELPFSGASVCIVGNINRDVKLTGVPASEALFHDGETPLEGVIETIGGGGANSACVAAALGASVRFVGKTGDDALGVRLRQAMEKLGVSAHLARDPRYATGTSVALGFSTGHRHFLSCLPNNQSLCFQDLDLTALDGCAHLLRADVWFSQQMLEEGNRLLLAEARRRGLATSLDINFDPHWSVGSAEEVAHRKKLLRGVLDLVDLAHGNVRELREFTDSPDLETALKRLSDWGVKATVVHLGAQGAGYYAGGQLTVEPACLVERPVNATGCGDVLSICMILLQPRQELSLQQKLRLSNSVVREFMEGRRAMIPVI